MKKIGVLGAGTWGVALARMLAKSGNNVTIWSAVKDEIDYIKSTHLHPNLPSSEIPESIKFTYDVENAVKDKDVILMAVASIYVRGTAQRIAPYLKSDQIIVDVAKGIEANTLFTMTEVIRDELNKNGVKDFKNLVALSGPTHAEEVARDLPTAIVSACENQVTAEYIQDIFMNTCMRVYTNHDIKGVEICGALKNIIALASGICYGLGYGDNAKAALITRGMAEISRLGIAMGCTPATFSGLAGIGDLIVTTTSMHSRNNRAGLYIGQGLSPQQAIKKVGMVVEGINAIPAALELAEKYSIEMPIVSAVNAVVNQGADPMETVLELMQRKKRNEQS